MSYMNWDHTIPGGARRWIGRSNECTNLNFFKLPWPSALRSVVQYNTVHVKVSWRVVLQCTRWVDKYLISCNGFVHYEGASLQPPLHWNSFILEGKRVGGKKKFQNHTKEFLKFSCYDSGLIQAACLRFYTASLLYAHVIRSGNLPGQHVVESKELSQVSLTN